MPKLDLRREYESKSLVEQLLYFFGGNPYHAVARESAGTVAYIPVNKPLDEQLLADHLAGRITLGSYAVKSSDNTVNWLGWDVDSQSLNTAKQMAGQIVERLAGIPFGVEFSGSKGYHILVFLTEPMDAAKAKAISEAVRDGLGLPRSGPDHVECYPKQGRLTDAQRFGSLLKVPLGKHPRTHESSAFVDPLHGWEVGEPVDPEQVFANKVAPAELDRLLETKTEDPMGSLQNLLLPVWSMLHGQRHNFALYLSGYLAQIGWGLEDAKELITKLCEASGDGDLGNRRQAVEDTFRNVAEGRRVKGFAGLNEMIPGAVLQQIVHLASERIAPDMVQQVDSVRLRKAPIFERVRLCVDFMWADLQERGEFVQTSEHHIFWYNGETHLLMDTDQIGWEAELHASYGLNVIESFGRLVAKELQLKAITLARVVKIRNRTFWDGKQLFINLNGPEVYILNGEGEPEIGYNGECGHIFRTDEHNVVEPDLSTTISPWEAVVDDLSFATTQDAPASPEEQRELLRAWILAFFFQEIFQSRPILLAIGAPGSGKTTAMRRILRLLEGPESEVLEIVQDKPDALRASLERHRLIVLDNLERSGVAWLADTLNRLATGTSIELRQLYATNRVYTIRPEVFVALTAVSMPFSDEALFTRLLPIEMQPMKDPLPEAAMQNKLREELPRIWGGLILELDRVVRELRREKRLQGASVAHRLADFAAFCDRLGESTVLDKNTLKKGLQSLAIKQGQALTQSSPLVSVLEEWLMARPEEAAAWMPLSELYHNLSTYARNHRAEWPWTSPAGMARHMTALVDSLSAYYGLQISEENGLQRFRFASGEVEE